MHTHLNISLLPLNQCKLKIRFSRGQGADKVVVGCMVWLGAPYYRQVVPVTTAVMASASLTLRASGGVKGFYAHMITQR